MSESKTASEVQPTANLIEQDAVREQLGRIISSKLFRNSRRYPNFLRTVVEYTLEGRVPELKERTLGIEVFGRAPNYDTGSDPVVRITAGEVRKRIAQYYHEPGHEKELRIDLQPGSYVAEFAIPSSASALPEPAQESLRDWPVKQAPSLRIAFLGIALLIICAAVALAWNRHRENTALDRFWSPVLHSPDRALLCVAPPLADPRFVPSGSQPSARSPNFRGEHVALLDATTLSEISGLLRSNHKDFSIRTVTETQFSDLQNGPTVLVGAFNNHWTMRLDDTLRYRFFADNPENPSLVGVMDQRDPNRSWVVHLPVQDTFEDYAIVGRVVDPRTARIVVFAAGVRGYGTLAAGRFLTDPPYMREMAGKLPANWEQKNMEFVLATDVINKSGGPPRVVAWNVW